MNKEQRNVPKLRFPGFDGEWELRKLREIAQKVTEKNISLEFDETLTNSAEFGIINQREFFDKDISNKDSINGYYVVREDDFVYNPRISTTAPVGPINRNRLGRIGVMSPLYTVFKTHDINNRFLEWFFKSDHWHPYMYFNGDTGARSDRFSIKDAVFFDMPIPVPSTAEQNKIGDFFEMLDTLITLQQRKLDQIKEYKKGMLQKMFPKEGESVPEVRFPGFSGEWEQRKLGDIATFINGRAYSQEELLSSGKYKVLRVGNFYTNDSWYYSDMELDDKYYAVEGDLLYTWSATFGPHIWHGDRVIYHYHIWKVDLSEHLNRSFTVQLLEHDKTAITSDKNGSTMVHITKAGMEQKEILIPTDVKEQERIGLFLTNVDNLITLHQRKLDQMKEYKKGLLQQMFV